MKCSDVPPHGFLLLFGCDGGENRDDDPTPSTLSVESKVLADGKVGEVYAEFLDGTGGRPPYRWSTASDTLPPGIALEKEGALIGRPEEAGRFAFVAVLEDSDGTRVNGVVSLRIEPAEGPAPTPMNRCDSPTRIVLSSNRALIDVRLPNDGGGHRDEVCGLNSTESAWFLLLEAEEESVLTLALSGDPSVRVGLLDDVCPANSAFAPCGTSIERELDAGSYLIVVAGAPASVVQLDVRLEPKVPPIPMGPPTCDSPHPIDLSTGSAMVAGQFTDLSNDASSACAFDPSVEAVYTIALDEPADLRVTTPLVGSTVYYLRENGCSGPELACDDWHPIYLPALDAGVYHLMVEPRFGDTTNYSLLIERLPATQRPSNDTCANAELLSLASGSISVAANLTAAISTGFFGNCTNGTRALFYSVDIATPSHLMVDTSNADLRLQVAQGTCNAPISLACVDSFHDLCTDEILQPGRYTIAISEHFASTPPITTLLTVSLLPVPAAPANDSCSNATVLNGSSVVTGSFDGASDSIALNACSSGTSYPDLFYSLDLAERSDMQLTLQGFDMLAGVLQGGCGSAPTCIDSFGGNVLYGVAPGPLAIVVERRSNTLPDECEPSGAGDFQLTVDVTPSPPAPPNDLCSNPATITLANVGSQITVLGTTLGASDEVSRTQCPGRGGMAADGPDVFYRLELGSQARLRASISSSTNHILSLHGTGCAASGALACSTSWQPTLETLTPIPAGTYYLRVDHELFRSFVPSDFFLTAELF